MGVRTGLIVAALAFWGCAPVHQGERSAAPTDSERVEDSGQVEVAGDVFEYCAYGPPNYGETPATDTQEAFALLVLDEPIQRLRASGVGGPVEVDEVAMVQMVGPASSDGSSKLTPLIGRHARVVVAEWMVAETGHHHTRVILISDSVLESAALEGQQLAERWPKLAKDFLGTSCVGHEPAR